jgi:SAM-dependent methyltransferase
MHRYRCEFNTILGRNVYYIPENDSNANRRLYSISKLRRTHNRELKDVYTMFLGIIQQQLRKYPEALKIFLRFVESTIATNQPDVNIYSVLQKKYMELAEKYEIVAVGSDEQRGENRIRAISKRIDMRFRVSSYLDIGCFDGGITEAMGRCFHLDKHQTHGVDIKPYKDEYANITFTAYDGIKLPFSDDSFDLITCLMTLHHIPKDNLEPLLKEISRVMKHDGIIILREHDIGQRQVELKHHVLDIMHDFYDYVWSNKLGQWVIDFEKTNYKTSIEWSELLLRYGFIEHTEPEINKSVRFNPFGHYVCSYKKVSRNDVVRDCKIDKPVYRMLTDTMQREKYHTRNNEWKGVIHWGQRKLLLTEIEFLTIFLKKYTDTKPVYMIYAGAAPGTHVLYLSSLFPTVHFELYDPRDFNIGLKGNDMINTHVQYFTDDTAKQWIETDHTDKTILLVSDIRTGEPGKMSDIEVENRVKIDHEWQQTWYRIMNPKMAMFKFRLPWDDEKTEYLDGSIYIQPYPPATSTETRLIVGYNCGMKIYDNRQYEEQLFYYNNYERNMEYTNCLSHIKPIYKEWLKNEYDYAAEVHILRDYINMKDPACINKYLEQKIIQMVSHISRTLSSRRTLRTIQPIKEHKKNIMIKLQELGYIPTNQVFNQNTFNIYILPIYDKLLQNGHIDLNGYNIQDIADV